MSQVLLKPAAVTSEGYCWLSAVLNQKRDTIQRAAILFADFGPYHVARINALTCHLGEKGMELCAFRFSEKSGDYGWKAEKPTNAETVTLSRNFVTGPMAAVRIAGAFYRELRARNIKSVFLPSYSPLPNLLCFMAAKLAECRTILMTESWSGTEGALLPGKLIKHVLVRMFDSALVGGSPQRDYLVSYGMPKEKVFTGYDVVDVEHFAKRAEEFRASRTGRQSSVVSGQPESEELDALRRSLPERYFLNLGRFVEKKNLATLVAAYARYCDENRSEVEIAEGNRVTSDESELRTPASLVLVGEGPLRGDLEGQARDLGLPVRDGVADPNPSDGAEVVFFPFQQADVTPLFFARCEAFVLPSTREEWGLVVNEAMACGAPVLVSNRVGAHFDLVQEGINGFTFDPNDVSGLAELLRRFDSDSGLHDRLGAAGRQRIEDWRPERFGREGARALEASLGATK